MGFFELNKFLFSVTPMTLIIVSQVSDNPRIDLENLLVMQSYNIFGFSFVFVIYAVKIVI